VSHLWAFGLTPVRLRRRKGSYAAIFAGNTNCHRTAGAPTTQLNPELGHLHHRDQLLWMYYVLALAAEPIRA